MWLNMLAFVNESSITSQIGQKAMHIKAHVHPDLIEKGTRTALQAECDALVEECKTIPRAEGEFFETDFPVGLFDCCRGFQPGQRKRVLEFIRHWLSKKTNANDTCIQTTTHKDGSLSWSEVKKAPWSQTRFLSRRR